MEPACVRIRAEGPRAFPRAADPRWRRVDGLGLEDWHRRLKHDPAGKGGRRQACGGLSGGWAGDDFGTERLVTGTNWKAASPASKPGSPPCLKENWRN
jgi:hypothetical protein